MLDWQTYPIERRTDRDVELPNLLAFFDRIRGRVESAIDVGAQFSAHYYARQLRRLVSTYWALDPLPDREVAEIVNHYVQQDADRFQFQPFDLVISVSTLEHVGQYPIKDPRYQEKRLRIFGKMVAAAQKYLWVSVPVGLPHVCEGEMAIFGLEELKKMARLLVPYKTEVGYFWSEGPQAGHPWTKSTLERVIDQPYIDALGNRAVCIMEVEK